MHILLTLIVAWLCSLNQKSINLSRVSGMTEASTTIPFSVGPGPSYGYVNETSAISSILNDEASITPDQSTTIPDQSNTTSDQTTTTPDKTTSPYQSTEIPDESTTILFQSTEISGQTATTADETTATANQTIEPDQTTETSDESNTTETPEVSITYPDQTTETPEVSTTTPDQATETSYQTLETDQTTETPDESTTSLDQTTAYLDQITTVSDQTSTTTIQITTSTVQTTTTPYQASITPLSVKNETSITTFLFGIETSTSPSITSIAPTETSMEHLMTTTNRYTTGSSSRSTSGTTSVPSTLPTTTLRPEIQEPNIDAASPFQMEFHIGLEKAWDSKYIDCSEDECVQFKYTVERVVNSAFVGCEGYISRSIKVIGFTESGQTSLSASRQLPLNVEQTEIPGGFINASYNASYENKVVLSEGYSNVTQYIQDVVSVRLENSTFDGVKVINGSASSMAAAAKNQVADFNERPCERIGNQACSLCFPCNYSATADHKIECRSNCFRANQICTANHDNVIDCVCAKNYLTVGGECVDKNVVIGVSVAVGTTVVVGLLIVICALGCRFWKTLQKDYKGDKDYQNSKYTENEFKTNNWSDQPIEVSMATIDSAPNVDGTTAAAAKASASKGVTFAESFSRSTLQHETRVDLEDEHLTPDILQSDAYRNFSPTLSRINTDVQYLIRRPKLL